MIQTRHAVAQVALYAATRPVCGHALSQNIVAFVQSAHTVALYFMWTYSNDAIQSSAYYDAAVCFSVCYFLFDTLLCLPTKAHWVFVPHHLIAACLGALTHAGFIDRRSMGVYMYTLEFSNLFLNWFYATKTAPKLSAVIVPLLCATYIPLRLFFLPIITVIMAVDAASTRPPMRLALWSAYAVLQLMSWEYSRRLWHMFVRRYVAVADRKSSALAAAISNGRSVALALQIVRLYCAIFSLSFVAKEHPQLKIVAAMETALAAARLSDVLHSGSPRSRAACSVAAVCVYLPSKAWLSASAAAAGLFIESDAAQLVAHAAMVFRQVKMFNT